MALITGFDRKLTRRSMFFGAAASLLGAPAIVRATSLMPVRRLALPNEPVWAGFCERLFYRSLDNGLRTGRLSTIHNGSVVSVAEALRLTEHARAQGWLPGIAVNCKS
jgi:hypothetical protein